MKKEYLIIIALLLLNLVFAGLYFTKPQITQIVKQEEDWLFKNDRQSREQCMKLGGIPMASSWNGKFTECKFK